MEEPHHAAHEVPQVVGEPGGVGPREQGVAEVGVAGRGDVPEEPVAHGVHTPGLDEGRRIDPGAERLAHPASVPGQEAVDEDSRGDGGPGRQQHRRPVDGMKPEDVLADHVDASGALPPVPSIERILSLRAVTQRRDVVREGIEPDVDHLVRVARDLDPPAARAGTGAGDAEILEAARHERTHLPVPLLGDHPERPLVQEPAERLPIAREPKEVVLLLHHLGHRLVIRAAPVEELVRREEALAANAVESPVRTPVHVSPRRAGFPEAADAGDVARVRRGPDEVVVREAEYRRQLPEALGVPVDQVANRKVGPLRGQDVGEAVLVGAGQEAGVVPAQSMEPREDVGLDELQREPEMRLRVDVRDRGGDVVRAHPLPPLVVGPWPHDGESRTATGRLGPPVAAARASSAVPPPGWADSCPWPSSRRRSTRRMGSSYHARLARDGPRPRRERCRRRPRRIDRSGPLT